MKNICLVCSKLSNGGAERFTVNLANSLVSNNSVFIITEKAEKNEYSLNNKVSRVELLSGGWNIFRDSWKLRKFIKKNNIDIVIGIDLSINIIVCLQNFFSKSKVVISERNSPTHVKISRINKLLRFILYRNADGYVFQSQEAMSYYSNKIQLKGVVIHNPVSSDLPYRNKVNKELVAIGRLHKQKNYPMMLESFSKVLDYFPEYRLRIFGKGEELDFLKLYAKKLGIEKNVIFEGFSLKVHDIIKNSDIFLLSSDYEGMPNVLLEAMAMGFPVVATDSPSGGVSELIQNNYNGLLSKTGDSKSFSENIIRLLINTTLKNEISKNAVMIRETHSIDNITKLWESYFSEILK